MMADSNPPQETAEQQEETAPLLDALCAVADLADALDRESGGNADDDRSRIAERIRAALGDLLIPKGTRRVYHGDGQFPDEPLSGGYEPPKGGQ